MGSLWNRSGTIERFADDLRAAGAKAYFFNGGTTTPLSVFQDAAESAAHPHPIVADANGRWPDIFVPYILSYDVRVTSSTGVQLTYTLEIPNPDPIDLTVTIPAQEKIQTGMVHAELVNTTRAGFVRLNGRTLGNGASLGTERANADTVALFTFLYNNLTDAIAPVSNGRALGSAALDYAANATIALPNCQGAVLIGLDDMGNTAGAFFTGLSFNSGNATTAGSSIGVNGATILLANMPAHTHTATTSAEVVSGTTNNQSADHTHSGTTGTESANHTHNAAGGQFLCSGTGTGTSTNSPSGAISYQLETATGTESATHTHDFTTGGVSANHTHTFTSNTHTHTLTTSSQGSGTAFNNLPRSVLVTWYIKL